MPRKPIVYILIDNHFDPTWRRCFRRRFTASNGDTYASYAEIEALYIEENLALARRHRSYKFQVESPIVLRTYLEAHAGRLPELRRLARAGRFAVGGTGDNIVDANLVLGESLVRNFVSGMLWTERTLGQQPALAVRNDAFGNSAQLPQILRGCGLRWVRGLFYSPARGSYWRGLDGSTVCCAYARTVGEAGTWDKYPPCSACRGRGCRVCGRTGLNLAKRASLPVHINEKQLRQDGFGVIAASPEEHLPNPELVGWARKLGRRFDVRFALAEEIEPHVRDRIARVDNPPPGELHPGVELNPNNTGVFVTRIRNKQTCRRQEYALLQTETLAALASLSGAAWPRAALEAVWQPLLFTMFHDSITSTHVDAAHVELEEVRREIDRRTRALTARTLARLTPPRRRTLSAINLLPEPQTGLAQIELPGTFAGISLRDEDGRAARVIACEPGVSPRTTRVTFLARNVPGLSSRAYACAPAKPQRVRRLRAAAIRNRRYRIAADEHGLCAIFDQRLGRAICAQNAGARPNELILETDIGSPWATLLPSRDRQSLAPLTTLARTEAGPGFQRMVFDFAITERSAFSGNACLGTTTVTLLEEVDRVEFQTRVRWQCHGSRLRVAMPLPFRGAAVYGIPYGMLAREAYVPTYDWAGANGDWPATDWAGVESAAGSVAILNRGIPSYAVEPVGRENSLLLLSALRSPTMPTALHEPRSYTMVDYDGMRDEGWHTLEYALQAYDTPFAASGVVADAAAYNAGLLAARGHAQLPEAPRVLSANARLTALKCAEEGAGLMLRLVEFRGLGGPARIQLPAGYRRASRTNLLERELRPLIVADGQASLVLRPWEIASVRLSR